MSYLILVYTNPISEILDVVCYSDVQGPRKRLVRGCVKFIIGPS